MRETTMASDKRLSLRAAAIVCAFVGALVYVNTLDCGFCFDDAAAIEENMDLRPSTPWSNLLSNDFWGTVMSDKDSHKSYRPLCVATFRLNYLIHELQPMGYHLVNVLLHSAVCYLYVLLCGVVFGDVWPSLIAGLLFAVHPIHTEAVAGLVGRADILGSLFFMGAFLSYRRLALSSKLQGYKWLVLSLFLCLCSALSKETGITVVALCLTYEFFILNKMDFHSSVGLLNTMVSQPKKLPKWFWQFVLHVGILAVFTASFLMLRVKLNEGPPVFSILNNPAMAFNSPFRQLHWSYLCFFNLWLLLNPGDLVAEYSMSTIPSIASLADPRNLLSVATFTSVGCLGLYSLIGLEKQRKIVLFGLSLMIFPFIPASNLFFPVGFVVAERVLYIPSMGFTMLVGYGTWHIFTSIDRRVFKNFFLLGLISVFVIHSAKTMLRNRDWYSSFSLYTSAVRTTPGNGKMVNNLATVHDKSGNRSLAEELFRLSTVIEPEYITGYMNLAFVMKDQERYEEAIEVYKDAASLVTRSLNGERVHITPKNVRVFNVLSDLLNEHMGDLEEALQYAIKATEVEPQYEGGHNNKGCIMLKMGQLQLAKVALEEAVRLNDSFAISHSNLGEVYKKLGDIFNAEKHFRKALSLDSDHILTKFRLASLVVDRGQAVNAEKRLEAVQMLLDVLSVEPENGNATFTLGLIYYDLKNFSQAEEMFLRALEVSPEDQGTLHNLGVMLTGLERYPEALTYLEKLIELNPNHMLGVTQMGTCYMQMNQQQKAREILESVLLKDPTQTMALQNLGLLMIQMREIDEAIRLFTELIRLDSNNEPVQKQLVELHKYKQRTARGSPPVPSEPTKPENSNQ